MVEQLKQKFESKLTPFIDKLKQYLDINQSQAWELFCIYLLKEYPGSTQSLLNYLATETNTASLLNNIWDYVSLERMTQLKVVKNILEYCSSDGHPYADEYRTILTEIDLGKMRKSYIDQLTQLIAAKESPPATGDFAHSHARLVSWAERKLHETNEVLQILLLIIELDNIEPNQFKTLLNLFKSHSFGRQQQYLDVATNSMHHDLVTKITYNEVAIFIKSIDFNCV